MIEKNPAAVELGKLGGKARASRLSREEMSKIARKGVRARMKNTSPERRKEIAHKAAIARWNKAREKK